MANVPSYWFFISEPFHSIFYRTTLTVSIISNTLLIIAIKKTTTMSMGSYKYLLLCFAIWDMIRKSSDQCFSLSSLAHSLISPIIHMTDRGFYFIPKRANELRSENATLGKTICLFYVMTYWETLNVLTFHFIYRFRVIVQGRFQDWTSGWRVREWFAAAMVFIIVHAIILTGAMSLSSLTNEYTVSLDSAPFISLYGINTSDPSVGYVLIEIQRRNISTGKEYIDGGALFSFLVTMAGFGLSFTVIVACSVFIMGALGDMKVSTAMKEQQRVIFRALLIQTLVPCLFSYCPIGFIWFFPLLTGISLGAIGNLLVMVTTVFPSIDAVIIIIFIPAYKQTIKTLFLRIMQPKDFVVVSNLSMSQPSSQAGKNSVSSNVALTSVSM